MLGLPLFRCVIHVVVHLARFILLTPGLFVVIIGSVRGNVLIIIVVKVCAVCLAHGDLIRSLIHYRCYFCNIHDLAHFAR